MWNYILFPKIPEINHYICPYETERCISEHNIDNAKGAAVCCA